MGQRLWCAPSLALSTSLSLYLALPPTPPPPPLPPSLPPSQFLPRSPSPHPTPPLSLSRPAATAPPSVRRVCPPLNPKPHPCMPQVSCGVNGPCTRCGRPWRRWRWNTTPRSQHVNGTCLRITMSKSRINLREATDPYLRRSAFRYAPTCSIGD